jgi:hypothetical protein
MGAACQAWREAGTHGQVIVLSLDPSRGPCRGVDDQRVRVGDRALPGEGRPARRIWALTRSARAWTRCAGGYPRARRCCEWQSYPSRSLGEGLQGAGWHSRWRLKGNLAVEGGQGDIEAPEDVAVGGEEERRVPPQAVRKGCADESRGAARSGACGAVAHRNELLSHPGVGPR